MGAQELSSLQAAESLGPSASSDILVHHSWAPQTGSVPSTRGSSLVLKNWLVLESFLLKGMAFYSNLNTEDDSPATAFSTVLGVKWGKTQP